MSAIEMVGYGGLYALALMAAGSFLISWCWVWGEWYASDSINSILERREMEKQEEKERQGPFKFNPKRKD